MEIVFECETESITYDDTGYTLEALYEVELKDEFKTKTKKWKTEGCYGTLEQVLVGMHKHKFQASSISSVQQLVEAQNIFVEQVKAYFNKKDRSHTLDIVWKGVVDSE